MQLTEQYVTASGAPPNSYIDWAFQTILNHYNTGYTAPKTLRLTFSPDMLPQGRETFFISPAMTMGLSIQRPLRRL